METKSFCGQSCHIMEPEWTAYQFAPHAEVACVDCHIGEGAESFVAAKLNGTMQLIEVIFDSYPRPVPTPVHNLAQGKLTFILTRGIGEAFIARDVPSDEVEAFLEEQLAK